MGVKNRKAICTVIIAAALMIIAVLFKDNMPKVMHYGICSLGIVMAFAAIFIENKKK